MGTLLRIFCVNDLDVGPEFLRVWDHRKGAPTPVPLGVGFHLNTAYFSLHFCPWLDTFHPQKCPVLYTLPHIHANCCTLSGHSPACCLRRFTHTNTHCFSSFTDVQQRRSERRTIPKAVQIRVCDYGCRPLARFLSVALSGGQPVMGVFVGVNVSVCAWPMHF